MTSQDSRPSATFITLDEARAAAGVKLVVAASLPSPWSEAAKGVLYARGIDARLVRFSSTDKAVSEWMGWHNVPVLMIEGQPIRTGWADILEEVERLAGDNGTPSLIPKDSETRVRMFGLAHELLGENGLVWAGRLLTIDRGLQTEGKEGFPLRIAQYLAPKYGHAQERVDWARARVLSLYETFARLLAGNDYALGGAFSALDIYLATALAPFAPMSNERCPDTHPIVRHAFATGLADLSTSVPPSLIAHRDRIYDRHLELPVRL